MRKQTDPKQSEEALAFTTMVKNLLAVPKKEIDAEKAKYEKQKEDKNVKRAT